MVNESSKFNFNEQEIAKTLEKWGEELKVTTKDLSEIGKTFGEKYEAYSIYIFSVLKKKEIRNQKLIS